MQDFASITADVPVASVLCRQDIAGPRIMAAIEECIAHCAGELTGHQNPQGTRLAATGV
jgi:hypothetical protein